MSWRYLDNLEHSTGSLGNRVASMTTDKQEIKMWIGTAILILAAAAFYIWMSTPEADLLPEIYNVM